jgi:hypothetical protein
VLSVSAPAFLSTETPQTGVEAFAASIPFSLVDSLPIGVHSEIIVIETSDVRQQKIHLRTTIRVRSALVVEPSIVIIQPNQDSRESFTVLKVSRIDGKPFSIQVKSDESNSGIRFVYEAKPSILHKVEIAVKNNTHSLIAASEVRITGDEKRGEIARIPVVITRKRGGPRSDKRMNVHW